MSSANIVAKATAPGFGSGKAWFAVTVSCKAWRASAAATATATATAIATATATATAAAKATARLPRKAL